MIFDVPDNTAPVVPAALLNSPAVQHFLTVLHREAPGLDITWDRAIVLGWIAAEEARAGRLPEHRALLAEVFAPEDYDVLIAAALALLDPSPAEVEAYALTGETPLSQYAVAH